LLPVPHASFNERNTESKFAVFLEMWKTLLYWMILRLGRWERRTPWPPAGKLDRFKQGAGNEFDQGGLPIRSSR
jgi:hypothetical protein